MNLTAALRRYRSESLRQLFEIENYYQSLNFEDAVQNAAKAIVLGNKMDSHQFRIGRIKCEQGSVKLLKRLNDIRNCEDFDDLFDIVDDIKNDTFGLGDLWSYDTALRIGFNLAIYPENVFVQAGVRKGVRKVLGYIPSGRSIAPKLFPSLKKELLPYQIENFLCLFGKDGKRNALAC